MSKTRLQLVNGVLERLRESTVTAVSGNAYASLIAKWVNDAKREIEDAWEWNTLRTTVTVTTVAGTQQYSLAGTNKRSRIIRFYVGEFWVDGWNDTHDNPMFKMSRGRFEQLRFIGITQSSNVIYFTEAGWNTSDLLLVDVWPKPIGVDSLKFIVLIPQADLTADATALVVPDDAVELLAYAKAIRERGEDGGDSYVGALSEAMLERARQISFDTGRNVDEVNFYVV